MAQDEEIIIGVKVETGEAAKSLKQLKDEYKEHQKALNGLEVGSKAYVDQLKKLGAVKDEIGDLNQTIQAFNPEGKIKAFSNVIGGLASGFQAAQGAAALFGKQSEDVQAALLKVQGAMAFSEGIKGIVGMQDAFSNLWLIIKANPLQAIIAAITALAAVGATLYTQFSMTSQATKDLTSALEKQHEISEALSRATKRQIELLTAQGGSEREIIAAKEKLIQQQIIELQTSLKLHERKLQDVRDNDSVWESTLRVAASIQSKLGNEQMANNILAAIQINKRERAEEDLKAIEKEKQDLLDLQANIQVLSFEKINLDKKETQSYLDELAKRKTANDLALAERKKQQEYLAGIDAEVKASKEQDALNEEAKKDAAMLAQFNRNLLIIENETAKEEKIRENNEKTAEQKKALQQAEFESSKNLIMATQAITDLVFTHQLNQARGNAKKEVEIKKRQFRVNKAFGIANSVIDGIGAVQKALNNPYPLNLILAIASGLLATANTVKIATTKFDDGGGGGDTGSASGNLSLGSVGAPVNPPSSGSTNLNADGTIKATPNVQPQKVFVVESEMTGKQNQVARIEENAKI